MPTRVSAQWGIQLLRMHLHNDRSTQFNGENHMRGSGSRAEQWVARALLICVAAWCTGCVAAEPHRAVPVSGSPWRETIAKLAQEHFKNPAWGYSHSVRDYGLARQ